jgi:hypothetical protein
MSAHNSEFSRRLWRPLVVPALAFVVLVASCDDDGGVESISKADWIEQADEICVENDEEIAALDEPTFDASDDLTDEQLEEAADFLEAQDELQEETVDSLEELPPPEETADADEVEEILGVVQQALDDEGRAIDAARDGDAAEFTEFLGSAADEYEEAQQAAADFGLEECGQPNEDEPVVDDNTGLDDNTGAADPDEPSDIAPVVLLDSFTGEFETEFQFVESGSIVLLSDAVYVDGDQDCTEVTDLGEDLTQEERVVVVGDEVFYEKDGAGVRTDLDNPDVNQALDNCVSSDAFWDGFPSDLPEGDPADFNGIPSERVNLLEVGDQLEEPLDLPPGFDAEQFDVWIAEDGGWVVGSSIRYSGPAQACRDLFPEGEGAGEACTVRIDVRIADPDNPSLTVELPRGSGENS